MTKEKNDDLSPEDLDLIDAKTADIGKSGEDLWDEIDQADAATKDTAPSDVSRVVEDDDEPDAGTSDVKADADDDKPAGAKADQGEESRRRFTPGQDRDRKLDRDVVDSDRREADEIFADASKEQRDYVERLMQRKWSAQGTLASLQRKMARLEQEHSRLNELSETSKNTTQEEREALEQLIEDYPEHKPYQDRLDRLDKKIDSMESTRRAELEAEQAEVEAQYADLVNEQSTLLHEIEPGWDRFLNANGEAFKHWVAHKAPVDHARIAHANANHIVDARATKEMLEAFKQFIGSDAESGSGTTNAGSDQGDAGDKPETQSTAQRKRERQLAASASPNTPGTRPVASGASKDADGEEAWKYWDAVDRQNQAQA